MPPLPWTATPSADASGEAVVMASVLQLDSFRRAPGFLRAAMAIRRQVLGAEGALGVALNTALPRRTFFTLSAWRDRDALNAFVRSEPHAATMRRYRPAMADARFVSWSVPAEQLPPTWAEAHDRLRETAASATTRPNHPETRPDPAAAERKEIHMASEMRLELVQVPVSDIDRAKAFYVEKVGFNADHDHQVTDELRFVQLTPPGSACSIALTSGAHQMSPGSIDGLQLVVADAAVAREELADRGVEVSDVQEFPWGTFVFFRDPDGNGWALQAITRPGQSD